MKFNQEVYKAMLEQYRKDQQKEVKNGKITQEEADFRCWMYEDEALYLFDDD